MGELSNEAALRLIRMYMQNDYATSDSKTIHDMHSYAKELIKHGIFKKQRHKRKKIAKINSSILKPRTTVNH